MSDLNAPLRTPNLPSSQSKEKQGVKIDTGSSKEQITSITHVESVAEQPSEQTPATSSSSGQTSTKKQVQQTGQSTSTSSILIPIPETEEEFRKVLHTEIKKKIDTLLIQAKKLQQNPSPESARALVDVVSELRKMTIMMKSLWQFTMEKLKKLYETFFPGSGLEP